MITRRSYFRISATIIAIGFLFISTNTTQAQSPTFSRSLKMGISGEDVRNLQKILNSSLDTAVNTTGPGSIGQETTYFGNLTREAVIRFQEKYRDEILVPNGLFTGTGFVGPATIAKLSQIDKTNPLKAQVSTSSVVSFDSSTKITTSLNQNSVTTLTGSSEAIQNNPNTKDLDLVLEAIDRIGQQNGFSDEQLRLAKQVVIDQAATTTDLNQKFIETVTNNISMVPQPLQSRLVDVFERLKETVFAKKAMAAIGTPFGGRLLFSMYCTQSQNWWIGVQPLPPSFATLLTYQIGTQIHLGRNIPRTSQLLGRYGPGAPCVQGWCPSCVVMPYQGMIYPSTGSSAI